MEKCTNEFCKICNRKKIQQIYFSQYQSPNIVIIPTTSFESDPPAKKTKFSSGNKVTPNENSQRTQEPQLKSKSTLSKRTILTNNHCMSIDSQNKKEPNHIQNIGHQKEEISSNLGMPLPPTNIEITDTTKHTCKIEGSFEDRSTLNCTIETNIENEVKSNIEKQVKTLLSSILPSNCDEKFDKETKIEHYEAKNKTITNINEYSKTKLKRNDSSSPSTHKNSSIYICCNKKSFSTSNREINKNNPQQKSNSKKNPSLKCKPRHNSATQKSYQTAARTKEKLLNGISLKTQKYKQSNTIKQKDSNNMSKVSTNDQQTTNQNNTSTHMKSVVHITKKYDSTVSPKHENKNVHNNDDLRNNVSKFRIRTEKRDNLIVKIPNENTEIHLSNSNSQAEQQQNIKTIKLVINLICQKPIQTESKINDYNIIESLQQPGDDLSFLDDFNVDDIVQCLNSSANNQEVTNIDKIDDDINKSPRSSITENTIVKSEEYSAYFDSRRYECEKSKQTDTSDHIIDNIKEMECSVNRFKKERDVDVNVSTATIASPKNSNNLIQLSHDDITKNERSECETESEVKNISETLSDYSSNRKIILTESKHNDDLIELTNNTYMKTTELKKYSMHLINRKVTETIMNYEVKSLKNLNEDKDDNKSLIIKNTDEKLPDIHCPKILIDSRSIDMPAAASSTFNECSTKFNNADDDNYKMVEINSDKNLQKTHYKKMLVQSHIDDSEELKNETVKITTTKDKNSRKGNVDVDKNNLIKTKNYNKLPDTRVDKILIYSKNNGNEDREQETKTNTSDKDKKISNLKIEVSHLIETNNYKTIPEILGNNIITDMHSNDSKDDKLTDPITKDKNVITDEDFNIKNLNKDDKNYNLHVCNANKEADTYSNKMLIEANNKGDKHVTDLNSCNDKILIKLNCDDGDKNLVESSHDGAMNLTNFTLNKFTGTDSIRKDKLESISDMPLLKSKVDDCSMQFNSDTMNMSKKLEVNEDKKLIEPSHINKKSINETELNFDTQQLVQKDTNIKLLPETDLTQSTIQNTNLEPIVDNKNEVMLNTFYTQLKNDLKIRMFNYLHDKYDIGALIHKGKFSDIFICKDSLGKEYGIKVLRNCHNRLVKGLQKEQMLMALQNEIPKENLNCVFLINSFGLPGYWCFLMEYYPKNLKQVLKERSTCFHINDIQRLSRQLVSAVVLLRNNNIVHSDIKPGHILLNVTLERLKLCGFDEMRYHDNNFYLLPNIGTASYRAPEIILGISANFSIDVWATALVMYEMATCRPLFPGSFNNDILYKQIETLGMISQDMIYRSRFRNYHFCGKYFMRKFGPRAKDVTFISNFIKNNRLPMSIYKAYNKQWAKCKTKREKRLDEEKLALFIHLLEQMLAMHPHERLPIEFVFVDAFIFEVHT